jgi:SAM-dependent methyltransferase
MSHYDAVPYLDSSHPFTHPDVLATVAALHGLSPPPPAGARVLDLGCAGGFNLVPVAAVYPDSQVVGIDLAANHVRSARAFARRMGLRNTRFEQGDIGSLPDLGTFDYIIAHGVYSWVPDPIRDALLAAIRRLLAPNGIATVSYNTLPGWAMRGVIRDMVQLSGSDGPPRERIAAARAMLAFVGAGAGTVGGPYGALLAGEAAKLADCDEAYLFHEHLGPVTKAIYFHEFVAHAATHHLSWLGEADLSMLPTRRPAVVQGLVGGLGIATPEQEQLADYLTNRSFRRSVLVHEQATVRAPTVDAVRALWFGSQVGGTPIRDELAAAWPARLPFAMLDATPDEVFAELANLEVSIGPSRAVPVSDRPHAFEVARAQVAQKADRVTNTRHVSGTLDDLGRVVIELANGRRTIAQIETDLAGRLRGPDGEDRARIATSDALTSLARQSFLTR